MPKTRATTVARAATRTPPQTMDNLGPILFVVVFLVATLWVGRSYVHYAYDWK
jgi:hypothetical protein